MGQVWLWAMEQEAAQKEQDESYVEWLRSYVYHKTLWKYGKADGPAPKLSAVKKWISDVREERGVKSAKESGEKDETADIPEKEAETGESVKSVDESVDEAYESSGSQESGGKVETVDIPEKEFYESKAKEVFEEERRAPEKSEVSHEQQKESNENVNPETRF